MPIRTVHCKIRSGFQKIAEKDVIMDPSDDRQVLDALNAALEQLGEEPKAHHRIELYKPNGEWIREVHAA